MSQNPINRILGINISIIFSLLLFYLVFANKIRAQNNEPDSIFVKGRNYEVFDATLTPSNKALGGNIFLGYGIYRSNISKYFSNLLYI